MPNGLVLLEDEWIPGNVGAAFEPTKSLVVRRSSDNGMYLHLPIELGDISLVGGDAESGAASPYWQLQNFSGDRAVWHGCPVVDASNSALLGILLIDARGPRVFASALAKTAKSVRPAKSAEQVSYPAPTS